VGDTVRLISWNTGRRARAPEQAEAILGRKPDLVALQEVTSSLAALFEKHLGGGGLAHLAWSSPPAAPASRDHGVFIASRYRLEQISSLSVPWPEKVVSAIVRTGDLGLEFHAVHLPPGSSNGWVKIETFEGIYRGLVVPSLLLDGRGEHASPRDLPAADGPDEAVLPRLRVPAAGRLDLLLLTQAARPSPTGYHPGR